MRYVSLIVCLFALPALAAAVPGTASGASLDEMASYLSKARDAEGSNHLAEAIRSYVTVLAIAADAGSEDAKSKAEPARAELERIGTRLSLEPSSEWLDSKGSQVAASSRSIGVAGGLEPSVYLYENYGTGKSPVADAPIAFGFVKNGGSLVGSVTTDAYGKANTNLAKLDAPGVEAVIRATVVFRSRGMAYSFPSLYRDFAYLPPSMAARVYALESSELGLGQNPQSADAVAAVLEQAGLQTYAASAAPAKEDFLRAFDGDRAALSALGADASLPYLGLVMIEVGSSRQVELNGKKYNIFTAAAKISFRLLRGDGSVVLSRAVDGVKGQGANKEAAVADAYRRSREALSEELQKGLESLRSALAKD